MSLAKTLTLFALVIGLGLSGCHTSHRALIAHQQAKYRAQRMRKLEARAAVYRRAARKSTIHEN